MDVEDLERVMQSKLSKQSRYSEELDTDEIANAMMSKESKHSKYSSVDS